VGKVEKLSPISFPTHDSLGYCSATLKIGKESDGIQEKTN
jgi:hypothetical protein